MPRFMLELELPMPSDDSGEDPALKAEDIEEAVRQVVEPVGATSVEVHWAGEDAGYTIFLRYESSHLVSAGIQARLASALSFGIRGNYRLFTSHEFALEHGASL